MLQQTRPPRFYLALIILALLTVLAAIVASGTVWWGVIGGHEALFMIAFILLIALERGGDLLIAAWLAILAVSWNWPRLGRWRGVILAGSVAAIVAVTGTILLARLDETSFAEWWRQGAPLELPCALLAIGLGVGIVHTVAVVRLFACAPKQNGRPLRDGRSRYR